MQFFSQFSQDKFIYETFFQNTPDGYFVDIGAYDGVIDSNSLFFENLGWRGICVEPNPYRFKLLLKYRKCPCVQVAIAETNKTASFLNINSCGPDTLNGLIYEYHESEKYRINEYNMKEGVDYSYIDVECVTFESLVKETSIDYLSLDTEGNELKILNTIDFNRYNIKTITVENNLYDDRFKKFFSDKKDYRFVIRLGCDEVYSKI